MDDSQHRRMKLTEQHQKLETEIAEELRRPAPDDDHVRQLKREKLHVKEELEGLKH